MEFISANSTSEPLLAEVAASARTAGMGATDERYDYDALPGRKIRRIPAWLLSIALHLSGMISLALWMQPAFEGAAVEPDRSGGVVLAQKRGGGEPQYFTEASSVPSVSQTAAEAQRDSPLPSAIPAGEPMADLLPTSDQIPGIAGAVGGGLPDPAELGQSGKSSRHLPSGAAETSVFGVSGTGSKFLYVFDRSASMSGFQGRPLASAKRELLSSLDSLGSVHQFQVIFYNDTFDVLNATPSAPSRLLFGDERGKSIARDYVRSVTAYGGTQHYLPLMTALRMQPDVIFFLTDGVENSLSPDELRRIRKLNKRVGASIHAVEFGAGPRQDGTHFLLRLTRENGGQYSYVDVTRLPGR